MQPLFNRGHLMLDGRRETQQERAQRFFTALESTGRFYRSGGEGYVFFNSLGPRRLFVEREMTYAVNNLLTVVRTGKDEDGEWTDLPSLIRPEEVGTLFLDSNVQILRKLDAIVQEPAVVPCSSGFRLLAPGYDPATETYYYVRAGEQPIEPLPGVHHLTECFSGVPFASPGHRANLIAWLLGAVCLDRSMDSPFLVVDGNQQGVGKSSCVQAGGFILSGSLPQPIDFSCSEFMKQLSTRFLEADRIMFLDNIVNNSGKSYDNSQLSSLLTQGYSKKIRILGHSRNVSASGILFAASVNEARLSTDLATRALITRLYRETTGPMTPYCKDYAIRHRRELYGELLWLATLTPPALSLDGYENCRFRRWLEFVAPRITPYFGPLAIQESYTLDDAVQKLFQLGAEYLSEGISDFDVAHFLAAVCSKPGFSSLAERFGSQSEHGRRVSAGRFLGANTGRVVSPFPGEPGLRLIRLPSVSPTTPHTYQFVRA